MEEKMNNTLHEEETIKLKTLHDNSKDYINRHINLSEYNDTSKISSLQFLAFKKITKELYDYYLNNPKELIGIIN